MQVPSNHPREQLLFFIAQDFGVALPGKIKEFILELAQSRAWTLGPPKFVDEIVHSALGTPVRTVGGLLEIYSAKPPNNLPRDVDLKHLEEVESLIESLRWFSREHQLVFEFELAGQYVGTIEDGEANRTLGVGLIGEWKRHHGLIF